VITALLAAVAMLIQDILGTLLVQAEARNRALLSAALDAVGWGAAIATTTISVSALQGHDLGLKVLVIVAVTAANIVGSWAGVVIGKRFIRGEASVYRPAPAGRERVPGEDLLAADGPRERRRRRYPGALRRRLPGQAIRR
jgi:hypothetical protein